MKKSLKRKKHILSLSSGSFQFEIVKNTIFPTESIQNTIRIRHIPLRFRRAEFSVRTSPIKYSKPRRFLSARPCRRIPQPPPRHTRTVGWRPHRHRHLAELSSLAPGSCHRPRKSIVSPFLTTTDGGGDDVGRPQRCPTWPAPPDAAADDDDDEEEGENLETPVDRSWGPGLVVAAAFYRSNYTDGNSIAGDERYCP